jgi:hypothetical protein
MITSGLREKKIAEPEMKTCGGNLRDERRIAQRQTK